ncbi:MAG TPA: hypothetical protein VFZ85_08975 [Jiangellaceae bacterium]
MGNLGLTNLTHARYGIPWLAIGVVATPAAGLMLSAFIFREYSVAWMLLRAGMLLWAASAAFVFDEPPAPVVRAAPRSPWWWYGSRFIGAVPLIVVPIAAASLWATIRPDAHPLGLSVEALAASLVVVATAAIAGRRGRHAPGELVASTAVLAILLLLVRQPTIGNVPLLPPPGDPRWPESTALWLCLAVAAIVVIAMAGWWTPKPRPARRRSGFSA